MVYLSPYYWNSAYLVFYDIPLFLLFFALIYIVTRFVVRIHDSVMSTAIAAFAASAAYFIIRSQTALYQWFLYNWGGVFGIVIILVIFMFVYFMLRLG